MNFLKITHLTLFFFEMEKCANHCCDKTVNAKQDRHCVTCDYCRDPIYCSRKCQAVDWVKHDCPNTYEVENIESTFFVPYHYEDLLCEEEIAELDARDPIFESYSLRKVNSDMTVEHRVQPSLIEGYAKGGFKEARGGAIVGTNPGDRIAGFYSITVTVEKGNTMRVEGQIPRDMIYKENASNDKARILAGGKDDDAKGNWYSCARQRGSALMSRFLNKQRDKYVFWPGVEAVYDQRFEMPRKGGLAVYLSVGDESVFVGGNYVVRKSRRLTRAVRRKLDGRLITKVRGVLDSTENLLVLKGEDNEGNTAILTVLRQPGSDFVQLIDVEFSVPRSTFREVSYATKPTSIIDSDDEKILREKERTGVVRKLDIPGSGLSEAERDGLTRTLSEPDMAPAAAKIHQFDCDPNDVESLIGLAMGLELTTCANPDHTEHLQELSVTISQFAREKLHNPGLTVTPYVGSAVTEALDALHSEYATVNKVFGGRFRKRFRAFTGSERILIKAKKFTSKDQFQDAVDTEMQNARDSQANFETGEDHLSNVEALVSMARQTTKKHDSFVLKYDKREWVAMKKRAKEIKKELKADSK